MSIQSVCAAPVTFKTEEEPTGCWQRFTEVCGCFVSKVVWLIGKIILWPLQIVSFLAFRILGVVWPDMASRAEALWNHLLLIGERVVSAAREEELLREIDELQAENRALQEAVDAQEVRIEEWRAKDEHQVWELGVFQEERDTARKERDQRLEGRTRLRLERDQLKAEKEQLTAVRENQQRELEEALQEIEVMKGQLAQGDRNEELLEQFRKIDAAYENRPEQTEGLSATELELQELIPIYERHKEAYKQMIQNAIPEEHELQIPLRGILRILNEEGRHLKRISEAMHFYAELRGLIKIIT